MPSGHGGHDGGEAESELVDEVRRSIRDHDIEVVIAGTADLNGIFRGKRVPAERFLDRPLHPVHVSDYFWIMDTEENVIPPDVAPEGWWPSWDTGFADVAPIPRLETFRIAPWLERTAIVLTEHRFRDGRLIEFSPREVLRHLVARAQEKGVRGKLAAELEFSLYRNSEASLEEDGYRCEALVPLNPRLGAYGIYRGSTDEHIIRPLAAHVQALGIPIEYWNPEGAAGQYEVNIVYADTLEAADRAFLFKHAVKEIAQQHGLLATFMAKVLPGFGQSCHVHASLWSDDDQPLMWDETAPDRLSQAGRHAIGGSLATLRDFTLLFCPNVNSYKRLGPDTAAGSTVSWGIENRTAGIRILNDEPHGCRIENRVPGGDANPYLVMAGVLAGMLYGIENKIEPPEPHAGNAARDPDVEPLPMSLESAIAAFESSEVAKEYLGPEFVRVFAASRRWELEWFRAGVTDWEIRRYLQFL
jgi:glutamine synthetase